MTSIDIYTPIAPTYLYIKQHSVTGLKYLGKTTRDPYKYKGSGKYWSRHIKKYGKEHIVTLWVSELYYDTSIVYYALQLSKEYNIVESSEWANLIPEDGLNGGSVKGRVSHNKGKNFSEETKQKMSDSKKGKPLTDETKQKISNAKKGRVHSSETKQKMSESRKGRIISNETRKKLSETNKNKPKSKTICPHCSKIGSISNMIQWHFDNCKLKI